MSDINNEVQRQLKILLRGVEDVVSKEELEKKIKKSLEKETPLHIKLGIDPTGTELHIGHAVPLRKLREFQECGHKITLIIGTFTAKIGDPTGKNEARKMLSDEDIKKNIATYLDQVKVILDLDKINIAYNHEWLEPMNLEDILKLLSQFTVQQMTQRKDFSERIKNDKPVSLVEFMYPLLQGSDSVHLEADVELGGVDQKFNLLKGRELQKNKGQEQQVCLMMPILVGLDGTEKMSKSLGNYIGITESPNDIFGKVMSVSDELMWNYYEIATSIPLEDLATLKAGVADESIHPMIAKKDLAEEIVRIYHGDEKAREARVYFENVFSKRDLTTDLPEVEVEAKEYPVINLLTEVLGFFKTTSDARRLINQGGLKIDGKSISDVKENINITSGMVIKAGKKKIIKIK